MVVNDTSCIKVSDTKICPSCKSHNIIKNGFTSNRKQQYFCKSCKKRCIDFYTNKAYYPWMNTKIIQFTKEGLGIRNTARILQITTTTLLKRILTIAMKIKAPPIPMGKSYEVDEMRTFIKRKDKLIWIVYALERETKKIVSFNIGARTNKTLNVVLKTLKLAEPKTIFTDGLKHYKYLIAKKIHSVKKFGTNHIERHNLSMRTNLKRLNRRSICFSRSYLILHCILKIYFWG